MSQPFVGEIRMFAGNFPPAGWMFCDGSILSIAENEVLFQLIGTTYGGDGQSTFALPNLSGRVPVHQGNGQVVGQQDGRESVTLTSAHMPAHNHTLNGTASAASAAAGPSGSMLGSSTTTMQFYGTGVPTTAMAAGAIGNLGGSQPHDNMAPFLAVSFIISLFGIFPSQS
jgi:microcystin-dependent protein